nr:MAG TPA: hypothetical protein [Caudoviricetes sp.]
MISSIGSLSSRDCSRARKTRLPEQSRFLWQQGALHDFPYSCRKNRFISDTDALPPL